MFILVGFLILMIISLIFILWNYERQVQDICRQLAFLEEKDSNMLITRQFDFGGIGRLCDRLNTLLLLRKEERKKYLKKEKLISETYTSLSHDIRTPLTSLDGYVQLLEMSLKNGAERWEKEREPLEEQERYMKIIRERIHSLKEILEEIFTFTKLKNEAYQLELSPCCMNRILKNVIFSYYEDWREQGIEPELSLTEEMLSFMGNVPAMNRVLQNMIKNGLDHGEKFLGISLQRNGNFLELSICNRTASPEEIDITQVFERFYKADRARSRNSTGLGLAVAKELVLHMQGTMEAELHGNLFSVFIRLPLN